MLGQKLFTDEYECVKQISICFMKDLKIVQDVLRDLVSELEVHKSMMQGSCETPASQKIETGVSGRASVSTNFTDITTGGSSTLDKESFEDGKKTSIEDWLEKRRRIALIPIE